MTGSLSDNGVMSVDGDTSGGGEVIVIDDEPQLVGLYASFLEDSYTVKTATNGRRGLEILSEDTEVVLLDRNMPGLTGDELLDRIREDGYGCRVAMVTSIPPDVDIVDMEFDAYLVKPVRRQDLLRLTESLMLRKRYCDSVQQSLSVTSRIVALESEFDEDELEAMDEYQSLVDRLENLKRANREFIADVVDWDDGGLVFKDVLGPVD